MNLWAHFLKIANLKAFLKKKNPAIFIIYDFFTPFVKLCGWRFLYFFSLCDGRNKAVFLKLEHSSLHGVKQKKHKKKHENLVFKPLLQEIWLKNLTIRKLFWSSKFSKKKKHATKSYRNWIMFNPQSFYQKSLTSIYRIATGNFWIKWSTQYSMSKIVWLHCSKRAKQFSKNFSEKFLHQYEVSRWARNWALVFLSQCLDTSQSFRLLF